MKLIVRIKGGLGNQLYCYAAARRLSLMNDCELIIDDSSGFERDFEYKRKFMLDYFNIKSRKAEKKDLFFPFNRMQRFLIKRFSRLRKIENRNYIEQEIEDFDPRILNIKLERNTTIDGLWQSELYFSDVENIIRDDLYISPPTDDENLKIFKRIKETASVAVHVRWFGGELSETNATSEYYIEALQKIEAQFPNSDYFVFSDDPDRSKKLIKFPSNKVTFVEHNNGDDKHAIWDLWLMSNCKNFIIANSTFSWWGAWLSDPVRQKVVYYPKLKTEIKDKWRWDYTGQMPESWTPIIVKI
ncbi:MAG: alpha-1,2-fucosyltransferase [Marinomonas sp.]|uniref:alpha-1,2-fucosyltransferase n=1 Tax=Marinomonas sp. TaxID=1904862 RepID=UPI003F9E5326